MVKKIRKSKKNSITFRLVSRSQQDPLINCDEAPQAVLVEQKSSNDRKAEQRKYGIYYDDDYDYLQHLKECEEVEDEYYFEEFDPKGTRVKEIKSKDEIQKEEGIIKLPSSLFPSQYQESVGMLNKAVLPSGIKPDWDQDIVQTFDDDYVEDEDNILDDDFLIQATGGEIKPVEINEDHDDLSYRKSRNVKFDDRDSFSDKSDDRHTICTVGSKTEFTNYSLTSSVIRRNEKLNDLDEHFENFFLKDIAEEEENISNCSDEENEFESQRLDELVKECEIEKNKPNFHVDLPKEQIMKIAERQLVDEEENREDLEEIEFKLATGKNEFDERWDCESILTNYSNIYNRPKLILEKRSNKIQINKKTGVPEEGNKLTEKGLKQLNRQDDEQTIRSMASVISQLSIRNKDETAEERKFRKKELKAYKKDRRLEKKANKVAFKEEHLRLNNEKVVNRQLAALKYN